MSNLLTRAITGTVFVCVVVWAVWFSFYTFLGLLFFTSLIGLNEYLEMNQDRVSRKWRIPFLFLAGFLIFLMAYSFLLFSFGPVELMLRSFAAILAVSSILMIVGLFLRESLMEKILGVIPLGYVYTVLFLSSWLLLFGSTISDSWENFYPLFLGFIILVWANDTFAYLVGRVIGKTKLLERISPKKTWEGTIGGALLCAVAAYVLSLFFEQLSPLQWIGLALITAPAATLGDLVESQMKRRAGVKDSGDLLPGHGGILDRFDATIIASPIVVMYLFVILSVK